MAFQTNRAPASNWPEELDYAVRTYDVGVSGFGVYSSIDCALVFQTEGGPVTAVSADTVAGLRRYCGSDSTCTSAAS